MSIDAMKKIASVVLAKPFSVPNAMPMLRWRVGVTRICSAMMIAEKIAAPLQVSQFCGRNVAYQHSVRMLTACKPLLIFSAVRVENLAGMEWSPFWRSNSWS